MNNTQFLLRMNMESFDKHTHINERKAVTELIYFFKPYLGGIILLFRNTVLIDLLLDQILFYFIAF